MTSIHRLHAPSYSAAERLNLLPPLPRLKDSVKDRLHMRCLV